MEMMESMAFEVSSDVYTLSGMANGKPDDNSRQVSIKRNFCLDVGRGPTMSNANFSPHSNIISGSTNSKIVHAF